MRTSNNDHEVPSLNEIHLQSSNYGPTQLKFRKKEQGVRLSPLFRSSYLFMRTTQKAPLKKA